MKDKVKKAISDALDCLNSVSQSGVELHDAFEKIKKSFELLDSEIVTIALLGRVSDGKTTTISGLLGRTMDNMKININESSDEIEVYEADFLGKKFRFVDTPGLFGARQKVYGDGKCRRFSSLTEQYISQANAIIYITEVSNPLPNSHQENLRHVMLDLHKLQNSIFVINRMDEKYDTLDEYDFADGVKIKTDNLRVRLKECLNLSDSEADNLNIVCIAAKPNRCGFDHLSDWFANYGEYCEWSHIDVLKNKIERLVANIDSDSVNLKTALDTANEAVMDTESAISLALDPIKQYERDTRPFIRDMRDQLETAQSAVAESKCVMSENLTNLESDIKRSIEGANVENFADVVDSEIGLSEGKIDFSIVIRKIESTLAKCAESANVSIQCACQNMVEQEGFMENVMTDALTKGAAKLKDVKISPELVGKIRDMFFKNFKFKPWGKINLAAKMTKWIGRLTIGINVGLELYSWWKQHKAAKEVQDAKNKLKEEITRIFNQAHKLYATNEDFLENFAPGLIELQKLMKAKDDEIAELKHQIQLLEGYQNNLRRWRESAEDVYFVEL